jgi:hypothetical protein
MSAAADSMLQRIAEPPGLETKAVKCRADLRAGLRLRH